MARRKIDLALRVSALLLVGLTSPSSVLATPEKASSYYEDALKRYDRNDIPAAVIQLKNAIQQDSKMLAAHLLLGKALLRNGDLKGAEAAFEEALKQGVNRGEVALPLGQVLPCARSPRGRHRKDIRFRIVARSAGRSADYARECVL